MGWFWADTTPAAPAGRPNLPPSHPKFDAASGSPPPGCPMHNSTVDALSLHTIAPPSPPAASSSSSASKPSGCPVPHDKRGAFAQGATGGAAAPAGGCPVKHDSPAAQKQQDSSVLSKLNPLNYMFHTISQERAPNQTVDLPTYRDESTIPRGDGDGNWEYPSPQQMYNALLRKGYTDTDATAVESMVAVHNFLNEGAWAEIVDWERRFGRGWGRAWQISRRGEENAELVTQMLEQKEGSQSEPKLIRFQGRPGDMTPKAAMVQLLGRVYPSKFGTEPPFDRHDWYVARNINGKEQQIRYVIDYYSGEPEPTGEPVFYLDVRPAMTPSGAVERLMRWGGDVWWRASGGEAREPWPKSG